MVEVEPLSRINPRQTKASLQSNNIKMSTGDLEIAPTTNVAAHKGTEQPILRTDKLVKIYGGRAVVNGIDIHVERGEIVGLVRPNGGRVYFGERDVTRFAMHRRARMGMGYLPQEESIFRKLTVEENIMAILEMLPGNRRAKKQR